MNTATDKFVDDLGPDGFESVTPGAKREKVTYPCESCGGSGKMTKTYGYSFQTMKTYTNKCKACKGRGSFTTPADYRAKARASANAKKSEKIVNSLKLFETANPGLFAFLVDNSKWSSFAASLSAGIAKYGSLTENQLAAAISMREECEARQEKKVAETKPEWIGLDVHRIQEMFAKASEHKLSPKFTVDHITLSLAPAHGKNPGAIYVKSNGAYCGKIVDGLFHKTNNCVEEVVEAVRVIAKDPEHCARMYGKAFSICSCCGRTLTNPLSIELGIGPICRSNWGW